MEAIGQPIRQPRSSQLLPALRIDDDEGRAAICTHVLDEHHSVILSLGPRPGHKYTLASGSARLMPHLCLACQGVMLGQRIAKVGGPHARQCIHVAVLPASELAVHHGEVAELAVLLRLRAQWAWRGNGRSSGCGQRDGQAAQIGLGVLLAWELFHSCKCQVVHTLRVVVVTQVHMHLPILLETIGNMKHEKGGSFKGLVSRSIQGNKVYPAA
mmetsp:Transcript_13662/g.36950  ORF Transcript_13662/g.36950 Transcript_13662/m.36950 type:complete len:213 (-) Transcript_13662:1109-1747(-)